MPSLPLVALTATALPKVLVAKSGAYDGINPAAYEAMCAVLLEANSFPVTVNPVKPLPNPIPSALLLNTLPMTARLATFSVEPMPAVLVRIRFPDTITSLTHGYVAPPANEIPVVQFSMMLLLIVTGPATALVSPNNTPREPPTLLPWTCKPVMVTLVVSLMRMPPLNTASAARVPLPVTPAFGPASVIGFVIDTSSAYVPALTVTLPPLGTMPITLAMRPALPVWAP